MNKLPFSIFITLFVSNVLLAFLSFAFLSFVYVETILQDIVSSRILEQRFIEAFGEDKRELIKECLRKHEEDTRSMPDESTPVNPITLCAHMIVIGSLGVFNCVLVICLLLYISIYKPSFGVCNYMTK